MKHQAQKHPCPDCHHCQWCSDDRCRLCLQPCRPQKLSIAEQIERYERLNRPVREDDLEANPTKT